MKILVNLNLGDIYRYNPSKDLTPAEMKLLRILKKREGRAVSSEILGDLMHRDPTGNSFSNVSYHVYTLRRKLNHSKEQPVIINKPGIGYILLEGKVEVIREEDV